MNDRFKFRGYWYNDVQKEWWVYDEPEFITGDGTAEIWSNTEGGAYPELPSGVELHLCQCTGLKDKNGKLIYEGDIVKTNENYCDYSAIEDFYINQNFVVEYFQPRAVYLLKPFEYKDNDGSGIYDLSPDFYEFLKWKPCGKLEEYTLQGIEVVGNIYENADLLRGEE